MIHFFVLLKPLGKKKLNKNAEGGKKAIIFPHQEESNYSHVSALLVYYLYPDYYKSFPEKSDALTFFLPNTRQIR